MMLRRLLVAAASNWAVRLLMLIVSLLLTPFVLHRLGEARYGLWMLAGSVVAYGSLVDGGLASTVVKYVAQYQAQRDGAAMQRIVSVALWFYGALGLLVMVASLAVAPVFTRLFHVDVADRATAAALVPLLGAQTALLLVSITPSAALRGLLRYDLVNAIHAVHTLASAALTVLVLSCGGGVVAMAAANVAVTAGALALDFMCARRVAPEIRFRWRRVKPADVRKMAAFGSALPVINAAWGIMCGVGDVVIAEFWPVSVVAPYAIAQRLSRLPQMLAEQCVEGVSPVASQFDALGDARRLKSLYLAGSRLSLAMILPFALTVSALAGPLLAVWIGRRYADYAPTVAILVLARLIDMSQGTAWGIVLGLGRHRPMALPFVGAALGTVLLSVLLVPRLGMTGAAIGLLVPVAVLDLGIVLPYAARLVGVGGREVLRRVLLPSLLPALPAAAVIRVAEAALEPSTLASIGCAGALALATYAAGYLLFSAEAEERNLLRIVVARALGLARFRS